MNVTRRAVPTLAFVLLAFLAAACGVEAGGDDAAPTTTEASTTTVDNSVTTTEPDEPTVTTTEPDEPTATTTTPDETTPSPGIDDLPPEYQDQILAGMIDAFVESGLTKGQAECLADSYGRDILSSGGDIDMTDTAAMMKYFTDCGIDMNDFAG